MRKSVDIRSGFLQLVRSDFARHRPHVKFGIRHVFHLAVSNPGFVATIWYRLQQNAVGRQRHLLAATLRSLCLHATGADFVPGCQIGAGLLIHHPVGIVVGKGAILGAGCTLLQQVTIGERYADGTGDPIYPMIEDGCTLGAGARVLGGILIGPGASVGANSVVLTDVPANAVAVGAPARVIKQDH